MLYHCLFLHLIMDVPPDCRLWDLACDAAVQRILQNEKKERDPMKIYQEFQNSALSPDSPELSAKDEAINSPDDHTFWKYTDRQKFLETIQQTLGGMSAAAGAVRQQWTRQCSRKSGGRTLCRGKRQI